MSKVFYQLLAYQWTCHVLCYLHNSIDGKISPQVVTANKWIHNIIWCRVVNHTSMTPITDSLDCTTLDPISGLVRRYDATLVGPPVNKELE